MRKYYAGEAIRVSVELTANHYGYFEFRLCQNDEQNKLVDQECFDKNPLLVTPGDDNGGGESTKQQIAYWQVGQEKIKRAEPELVKYRFFLPTKATGKFNLTVQLPDALTCKYCVLQWRYIATNNYGKDEASGECLGCAKSQETFQNCADIRIYARDDTAGFDADQLESQTPNTIKTIDTTKVSGSPTTHRTTCSLIILTFLFAALLHTYYF